MEPNGQCCVCQEFLYQMDQKKKAAYIEDTSVIPFF